MLVFVAHDQKRLHGRLFRAPLLRFPALPADGEPAAGAIVLEMTGPEGTADFLRALLSDARPEI